MKIARPLAGLFSCCLVAACGSGTAPPVSNNPPPPPGATNLSMQFFSTGAGIDRVKIPLLDLTGNSRPVNAGATDFTIEFWIKGQLANNPSAGCTTGVIAKDAWLNGVVVLDRDVLGDGDFGDFGIALFNGQVVFGVSRSGGGGTSLCGAANVLDNAWHHVAVTRQRQTGQLKIFVDGAQETATSDADADVSYNPAHANPDANDPFLVLGAQKRDVVTAHPFTGLIDELRISNVRRYDGTFARPTLEFTPDGNTLALYHFNEASGTDVLDASNSNASPGVLGAAASHSTDVPF